MPEETPETKVIQPEHERMFKGAPNLYGVFLLVLIGLATFVFVFAYMNSSTSGTQQAAAVAATQSSAFDGLRLDAPAAIVVDMRDGKVLFEKNADAQLPLASLTKVPLALAVSEVLSEETVITIPYDTRMTEGGQRLLTGERWKVEDVLHFTLVASSNEGAQILADAAAASMRALYPAAASEKPVLWRMNDLVQSLGLKHTYFLNVSGLDESVTQAGAYGSARDMSTLFSYAARARPEIFAATTKDGLLLVDESGGTTSAFNTNHALGSIPGLILGKTGFTDLAGGNLAIVFDVGLAQPVVAVVMGSTQEGRFTDMKKLVEMTRASIKSQ